MSLEEISILFIEDSKSDTRLILEYLKNESEYNYEIKTCVRLSKGIELLKKGNFDLILLDLTLPDSERKETLSKITDFTTEIPIIVLTGLDDKKLALESLQKGAQDYLVKDEINGAVLTRSILYAIERHKLENKAEKKDDVIKLDQKDKKILKILQDNYNISYQELSKRIGLAASTIHNRVQNLLDSGVIEKIDTVINPLKVGFESIAIIELSVDPLRMEDIAKKLASFKNIQLVASTTGEHDLIAKILAKNEKKLWKFINEKIKVIDGIRAEINVSNFIDIYKRTNRIFFET